MKTVTDIIEASGGYAKIVEAFDEAGASIDPSTPRKWKAIGIPAKHWPMIMRLSGASADDLLNANMALNEGAAA